MEMRARQLAVENVCLKNKFSDYGKGRDDPLGGLGMGGEDGDVNDDMLDDSYSSEDSDLDKVFGYKPVINGHLRDRVRYVQMTAIHRLI